MRMYTDLRSLSERFSKNAVEILCGDIATGAVAMAGLIFSWTALALLVWSALSRAVRLCRQHWGLGSALSARSPSLGFISARRSTVAFRSGSACCFRRATQLSPFWAGPASCCGGPAGQMEGTNL